jgi:hypothetical protein
MVIAEIPGFWIPEISCHKVQISQMSKSQKACDQIADAKRIRDV